MQLSRPISARRDALQRGAKSLQVLPPYSNPLSERHLKQVVLCVAVRSHRKSLTSGTPTLAVGNEETEGVLREGSSIAGLSCSREI